MDVTAIVLSYKRVPNINKVVVALQNNTVKPKEIIVVNNNPEVELKIDGAVVINCGRNFGCLIRHTFGLMVNTPYCLFIDDDLRLEPDAIANFLGWGKKFPGTVLGFFGRNLNRNSNTPYSSGRDIHTKKIKTITEVDIVKGRVHLCRTRRLAYMFTIRLKIPDFCNKSFVMRESEDILLSLANKYYGRKNYVIPSKSGNSYRELPEMGVSLYKRKNHWEIRDRAVKSILKLGVKL